jgi:hypothetical protein
MLVETMRKKTGVRVHVSTMSRVKLFCRPVCSSRARAVKLKNDLVNLGDADHYDIGLGNFRLAMWVSGWGRVWP